MVSLSYFRVREGEVQSFPAKGGGFTSTIKTEGVSLCLGGKSSARRKTLVQGPGATVAGGRIQISPQTQKGEGGHRAYYRKSNALLYLKKVVLKNERGLGSQAYQDPI